MEVDAVILAAGRSSRMGSPKVLLPAGPGQTLLSRVLSLAADTPKVGRILLVVGRAQGVVTAEAWRWWKSRDPKPNLSLVANPNFARGMSTSLIEAIHKSRPDRPLLVLLADQPLVPANEIAVLIRAAENRPEGVHSVSLSFGGPRPPAIVDATVFPDFMALRGDLGVRTVLSERLAGVMLFPPKYGPGYVDIDDWEIYAHTAKEQGWDNESARLKPWPGDELTPQVEAAIQKTLQTKPITFTAPGILFVPSYQPLGMPGPVVVPGRLLPGDQLKAAVVAETLSPMQYLRGLRQAALWALHRP